MTCSADEVDDSDYRLRLAQAVRSAIESGAETVTDLCRACGGAFPTDVVSIARSIAGVTVDTWPHRRWPDDALGTEDSAVPSMPEPHPIDFEWRYTAATADSLASMLSEAGGRIGCFGTPSVFVRLMHRSADAILIDRNPALLRHFNTSLHDRMRTDDLSRRLSQSTDTDKDSENGFDTILLDPPWYVGQTKAWLARALSLLRTNGRIILTLFPELLRPAAPREREELVVLLRSLGRVRRLDIVPRYTTPVFESETLSAFGLADLGQWRSGELFEVTIRDPQQHILELPVIENDTWERVQLGRQVVAIRHSDSTRGMPVSVRPVEASASFLLRSVSARDPTRQRVTVWTSRNRAALVTGTDLAQRFLAQLAGRRSPRELFENEPDFEEARPALLTLQALVGW